MDKGDVISTPYGEIKINDRKRALLTGIKKLVSFNPEEFVMESALGGLVLHGDNLEIIKLDTNEGILSIKGHIDAINYTNTNKVKESILSRLFK